ncbi:MAG: preprotein translocase subunit SecA, partial [Acidobacteria bacterium]
AQAGRLGAVTISTNMAGRGTDILLGGNPEMMLKARGLDPDDPANAEELERLRKQCAEEREKVVALGGLHVIGTERHEARRIDNQLRGRAGRQGDPGSSRFYLSLEDDLMRRFASGLMERALVGADDMPIESRLVSRAIERAQKQVEAQNFEIRKRLLEYDDVQNKQRQTIYAMRREILEGEGTREYVLGQAEELLDALVEQHLAFEEPEQRQSDEFKAQVLHLFGFDPEREGIDLGGPPEEVRDAIWQRIVARYDDKQQRVGEELMRRYERYVILRVMDNQWKDHLLSLDHLKEGIGLRAYAQRDPLVEYKRESYLLFEEMVARMQEEIVRYLMLLEPMTEEERREQEARQRAERERIFRAASASKAGVDSRKGRTVRREGRRVGRNEPCPCGSGKKYKRCCGA